MFSPKKRARLYLSGIASGMDLENGERKRENDGAFWLFFRGGIGGVRPLMTDGFDMEKE